MSVEVQGTTRFLVLVLILTLREWMLDVCCGGLLIQLTSTSAIMIESFVLTKKHDYWGYLLVGLHNEPKEV